VKKRNLWGRGERKWQAREESEQRESAPWHSDRGKDRGRERVGYEIQVERKRGVRQ